MSAQPKLPTLFGRFTTVLQDHQSLKKTLTRLLALCTALESGGDVLPDELKPAQLMRELQRELAEHFTAEESESYFGIVEAEEPALTNQIRQLRSEHQRMLERIATLSRFAADPECWPLLGPPLRSLIAQFELHERAESGLLNRFFRPRRR